MNSLRNAIEASETRHGRNIDARRAYNVIASALMGGAKRKRSPQHKTRKDAQHTKRQKKRKDAVRARQALLGPFRVLERSITYLPTEELVRHKFCTSPIVMRELKRRVEDNPDEAERLYKEAIEKRDVQALSCLVDAGTEVKDRYGWTPLHSAAGSGHTDIVKLLLDAGADKDVKNENGYTPLHGAARYGHTDIVELLLDAGADMEVKVKRGWTPLHFAAFRGRTDIVKLLLDAGADEKVKDKDGRTPLNFALTWVRRKGDPDMVKLLLDAEVNKMTLTF